MAVYVELPAAGSEHGWLAAADEVAAAELRIKLRTGGLDASAFPSVATLAGWIDAALDRETAFKCTAGLHHAVRHTDHDDGLDHHGFLNVLLATRAAFDGAGRDAVHDLLAQTDGPQLAALVREAGDDLARTRRWFTSFGSCDVAQAWADLRELGLVA